MASPSSPSSGPGRTREVRWRDCSPSPSPSPSRPASSYALVVASPSPAAAPRPGPRSEIHRVSPVAEPAPDVDGAAWTIVRSRQARREERRSPPRPRRRRRGPDAPSRQVDECPRCLARPWHPRSECRHDICCRRCRFFGHVTHFCTAPPHRRSSSSPPPKRLRPRSPGSSDASVAGPSGLAFSGAGSAPCASMPPSESSRPASSSRTAPASSSQALLASFGPSAAVSPLSGHPSLRPAGAVCYLPRSAEMEDAEDALQSLSLLAEPAGNRRGVFPGEVFDALQARFGLPPDEFSVYPHHPGDFLIRFRSRASRARVAATSLHSPRFRLRFTPWSPIAGGEPVTVRMRVLIEIRGIRIMRGTVPPRISSWLLSASSRILLLRLAPAAICPCSASRHGPRTLMGSPAPPSSSCRRAMALSLMPTRTASRASRAPSSGSRCRSTSPRLTTTTFLLRLCRRRPEMRMVMLLARRLSLGRGHAGMSFLPGVLLTPRVAPDAAAPPVPPAAGRPLIAAGKA